MYNDVHISTTMNNVFVNFRVVLRFHASSGGYLKTAMGKDDDKLWRGKGGTDPSHLTLFEVPI